MTDQRQTADPGLVGIWVRGWALSRGLPPPVADHGAHRVEVGLPEQVRRFVFPAASPGLKTLGQGIKEPWVFLKVCAPRAAVRAVLPSRWILQAHAFMMVRPVDGAATSILPLSYRLDCAGTAPAPTVRIMAEDGTCAASGGVALVQGHAIFDRIVTHEDHRRRGLGRTVMATLDQLAREHGARQGVLVATPAGRELYSPLGWTVHAPYTSAFILPG